YGRGGAGGEGGDYGTTAGGGRGGTGYYGGGGGQGFGSDDEDASLSAGGGGGGSSHADGASDVTTIAGSGRTPGNISDPLYSAGRGYGALGFDHGGNTYPGSPGLVVLVTSSINAATSSGLSA